MNVFEWISAQAGVDILVDEPMSRHTSFKAGGPAQGFACVNSHRLPGLLGACDREGVPVLVIGRGTNLLVRDGGIEGLVAALEDDTAPRWQGDAVTAQSGMSLSALARQSAKLGYTGLEFAGGIPGSVGGGLVMNAGAFGGEMSQVVTSALCLEGLTPLTLTGERMDLGYRSSRMLVEGLVVLEATFALKKAEFDPVERIEQLNARRRAKQPLHLPSAGSVFKRPQGMYAGALIEEAGLKGLSLGGAQVSSLHANFIVNTGGATASDIIGLIELVRQRVHEKSGQWLEPEIKLVGKD